MKKKGIKRALAFLLAVVFAFSTCMTAGPYTVQATEAGQTGSGEEEVGGGTTPDQGGTVDEKLSVKVVNNASIDIGPGLSDVNLKLTYNNGTEASLTIGKDQIGETVNTDISYDEVVAGTYDVVISDTNGLYNVTAETGIDEASKTLMITITGLSVKTDDNSISGAADDTVYAADENTFSVVGSWANYIDTWEIRDNTSGATIEENGKNCKVTTSRGSQDGAPAAFTIVAKVGTQEIASKLVTVKRKPTSLSVSSGEENGWLFSKEVTFTFTLKSGDTLVGDRTITGNYPENKGTTTFDCVTNENGEATHTVKLKKWQKDLAITGKFDGDNIYEPADIQGRYALNKYTGKILFEEETNPNKYSSENPLVVTYGTKDTELPITLCDTNGQSVEKDENESVETVDAVSDNSALVTVSADKTTKTVTITPKRAFTQPVRVTITGQTTNYKFSRDIYVQVDPYPLKIKEDSVHVFAPGKVNVEGAVEGEKIYDGTTKVDVKATLEAVEDDKYIPTDAAKGEIEAYKEVIFKNYDSKLKNVAENEAAQKMYFKPETLNNNVEFVSASATDIATFTNNYKIQDKRPSIEKELTIQKRVLELSVGNTSRGFRDLDYTRALDTLVSVNATTGETGFVTGEGTDLKGFKFPNVVDTTATDLNAENVKTKDTASYGEHAGALKLQADDQTNPTNNYKFDLIDYTSGNVEITEEKNVEGYVSVRTDSIHAYEAEDSTRYYGKDANVKFALTGDYNVIYSCDENGQNANNISESGLSLIGETKDIDRYFYLTNEVNGATIAKTQVFRLHFLYDETAPNCKQIAFGNQGGVVSNLEQAITFGIYKNHTIEATVTLSDDGSGVNGMAYFVANTATDKNYKDLLTEDDYAEALANEHFTDAGKPDENNTWTIKNIGKLKDGETIESNNYIVFVKAKDGKYANSNVTYEVTVQERFLKDLIVTINDKDYTLDQLEAQKDTLGIGTIKKDATADITKTTDSTLYKFTLIFDKDGDYKVKTTATDAATNTKSDDEFEFTIDTVAPELEVTYTAYNKNQTTSLLDPSKGRAYANEAVDYVTATAVMTERNFSAENVVAVVKAVNSQNADVSVADYAAAIKNKWNDLGEVSGSDNRHRYTITLPVINIDANYDFTYDYTDLAGNPLKATVKQAVTLDRVRPEGTVTVEDLVNGSISQVWNKLLNTITFGYFGKNSVRASMTSEDETAGVATTQYLVSQKALSRADLEKRTDWTGYSAKISLAANQHLVVYEKVVDKAGNIEFFSTDGIIVDNTNPTPTVTITPTTPAWGKGVYSAGDNPGFDVRVEDPVVNDAYSGLKTITYRIVNGTTGYTESGTLANLAKETHQQVWTGHVNINPNQFYSNDVQVSVYAEDWSTNSATSQTATLKVDNKAPIVSFSFDKSDVHNGKYYKNDKTLTITVDERNFDPSYLPRVTSTTGGGYSISGWSHNGEIHTATVTFSGDSDYTVSYDCYDLAGNKSNTENLEEFTVDKTVPVIKVSYNNNSALNGNYYKAARTATITVTEHNFDPSKITVSTTASAGGAPGVSGWSNNGDTHTANVVFNHDADYTFTVSGFDLAENKAADYAQDKFTVDLKNPEVKITGVKDKSANNGTVAPHISISDTNFITSGVKVTLKGANRGDVKIDSLANITSSATGMNVIFKDFPEGMDDIYTLTAKVTDKAGNETTSSITFSVNRDGSTYEIGSSTKALIDKKYTNKPQDLEITEINVDDLTTIEITYSLDGKVVTLKEGEDYTITKSGEDGQWKKYVYKIKASCFEKEGNYVINIYSEDAAHNSTTNKTKAKTIEFTVDKTAPTMVVSNLADRGRYKENTHEFTLNVKDNIYLAYVEVYLDGELFKRFEEDEIAQLNGELLVDIASSNQYQTIELVSCDKAGNISKEVYDPETNKQVPASYKVLVTQNSFVQFINNTPLLISVIVIFVAIIVLIIVLVKRKKDKQK